MRLLVCIASYGTKNDAYLMRLLDEYRSMTFDVEIVVLSNIHKNLGSDVDVLVGLPSKNPWSLPFGHRKLFSERIDDYDLFIYSEDDMLITQHNIEAFLRATEILHENEIAGFLQSEQDERGFNYCGIHSFFRWDLSSVCQRNGDIFAKFTNEHSASFVLTREHLRKMIASGGFSSEPHEGRYDMLCSAATDPYTQCGFTKLINISRLDDYVISHLPNRYFGRYGVSREELLKQIAVLKTCANSNNDDWKGPLFDVETRFPGGRWSKNLYEKPNDTLLALIPSHLKHILVLGCGWGLTEGELVKKGHVVSAVPVDPVFGKFAEEQGVEVIEGDFEHAARVLSKSRKIYDCLIFPDVLHLVENPMQLIRKFSNYLTKGGELILSLPNLGEVHTRWRMLVGDKQYSSIGDFEKSHIQLSNLKNVKYWLEKCQFRIKELDNSRLSPKRKKYSKIFGEQAFVKDFYIRAEKVDALPCRSELCGETSAENAEVLFEKNVEDRRRTDNRKGDREKNEARKRVSSFLIPFVWRKRLRRPLEK